MSYTIHPFSDKARVMFVPRLQKNLPDWPPKKGLDSTFPFQRMRMGDAFYLKSFETFPSTLTRCREFARRYNKTYFVHFVFVKHKWGYEVARII